MTPVRKIMLLGEIGVGKSSLVRRLVHDRFDESYSATIGVEITRYELRGAGHDLDLILWDTDGNFGDAIFRHSYVKGAAAALLVGDATRPATLAALPRLARGLDDALPGRFARLVVNKIDLLDEQQAAEWPRHLPEALQPRATSAKTGAQVREAFIDVAAAILRRGL